MILFTFGEEKVQRTHGPLTIAGFRYAVELDGLSLSLVTQCRFEDRADWGHAYGYYSAFLELDPRRWMFGRFHAYYDGPHDMLGLGPLKIAWQGDWCNRCYEGDE